MRNLQMTPEAAGCTKLTVSNCRVTKARDFEGEGGPEDKQAKFEEENPGDDAVREGRGGG